MQLSLFPIAQRLCNEAEPPLLLLACSYSKLDRSARAIDLYRGVMYQSYRAHLRSDAAPSVLILFPRHGFLHVTAVGYISASARRQRYGGSQFQYITPGMDPMDTLWLTNPTLAYSDWQAREAAGADRRPFSARSIVQHQAMFEHFRRYLDCHRNCTSR